ncbi:MAG: hypothetical protein JWQ14_1620, partial [Adhaeribacter sp.]|nr:hypothetical protein [Adhaeribacter sp.]
MKSLLKILSFAWLLLEMKVTNAQTNDSAYKKLLENMYRKTVPLVSVAEAAKWQTKQPKVI